MKKSKERAFIGLDLGSHSIKSVELSTDGQKIRLVRVSILPAPQTSEGTIKAIKLLLDPGQTTARVRVAVAGGSSLLIRRIQLPAMTASELKGAIRFEAEGHIPFPIDDCQIDFQILNAAADKKAQNVLLVAAKKDLIQERLKLMSAAGVMPEIIDVDIFCLINAFEQLGPDEKDQTFGLLNIGHQVSSFAIIDDKLPYFVREIPFGSKGVTQALAKAKGIPEAEAEMLKSKGASVDGEALKAALQEGFEPLADEIRHSIDFFENESGEELKTIWLSGGGALCPGAPEMMGELAGRKVVLWDNTQKMEIFGDIDRNFLSEHSAELNVALGMALRGAR